MPDVYVEPRPKGRGEGDPIDHYVLELAGGKSADNGVHHLTQETAINAAKRIGPQASGGPGSRHRQGQARSLALSAGDFRRVGKSRFQDRPGERARVGAAASWSGPKKLWNCPCRTRAGTASIRGTLEYRIPREVAPMLASRSGLSRRGSRIRVPSTPPTFSMTTATYEWLFSCRPRCTSSASLALSETKVNLKTNARFCRGIATHED